MIILTSKEEKKLSTKERIKYYEELKDYLLITKHENLSKGSLTICPKINPIVRKTLQDFCGYKIYAENNFVVANPNHTILLNSKVLSPLYKAMINMNGVVYVDKASKEDKNRVKLELTRLLYQDKSITMFPESAWNLSPNKLHLPLYIGMVDMARKTGLPIIPTVQEYEYKNKHDGLEHIDYVNVKFGNPIYVKITDDLEDKLEETSTAFSTLRWNLIERKGIYRREDITEEEYINFVKASIHNLEKAGIDMSVEQQYIFGANNPFYEDHYLNAVDWDQHGHLLDSPKKIIKKK